jgi:tetratricopeptide (TPR) repeat protein
LVKIFYFYHTPECFSVEKRQLINLLHHFDSSSTDEANEVITLLKEYPYSQVLHSLSARVSKDHQFANQQDLLSQAAIYSTDRSVLKEVMTLTLAVAQQAQKTEPEVSTITDNNIQKIKITAPGDGIDYADEIIADLKRLHELKSNFENVISTLGLPQLPEQEEKKKRAPGRPRKKIEGEIQDGEPLIEEIKTSKKKIDPESPKSIEQIAIIDQFIKAQPSIKPKAVPVNPTDLAGTNNDDFSDTIVSETLAQILTRQGKKDKAIEVYKKLIWKFPQKKAYFAAQIEDLKK